MIFFRSFHFILGNSKSSTVLKVQPHFRADVRNYGGRLFGVS
jgi:hypothetical protein